MSNGNGNGIIIGNVGTADSAYGGGGIPTIPGQPNFPVIDNQFWRTINAIWPDLVNEQVFIAPARNGMNRSTGALLQSWAHVEQSMTIIFQTPYHERVLRRWVGSFVPMLLGELIVPRIITRFFWAIVSALDLWEPDYRLNSVDFMGGALNNVGSGAITGSILSSADLIRLGQAIFRYNGQWLPRAHLGDPTPYEQKSSTLIGAGANIWQLQAPTATST